ncbi:MAG TPA: hypothetical protein DCM28_22855 [Phycisphaerales bacterium]|nr:hypothetical protein [Phycisphaerales bacterium]
MKNQPVLTVHNAIALKDNVFKSQIESRRLEIKAHRLSDKCQNIIACRNQVLTCTRCPSG